MKKMGEFLLKYPVELSLLSDYFCDNLSTSTLNKVESILKSPFQQISYENALRIVNQEMNQKFEFGYDFQV